MAPSRVSLPLLRLSSRQEQLEVSIRGSLLLDLPAAILRDNPDGISTATALIEVAKDRQLWVNRVGPCLLCFSVSSEDTPLSRAEVRESIRNNDTWSALSLRLADVGDGIMEDVVFSVQHPDLNSSLIPPRGVLTAELKEVRVYMEISRKSRVRPRARGQDTVMENPEHTVAGYGLEVEDLRAIEDFLSGSGIPQQGPGRLTAFATWPSPNHASNNHRPRNPDSIPRSFIRSAIDVLLLGGRRRHAGLKKVEGHEWDGLVHLAPAVFHVPYLQNISHKAKFMPTIAMSLAQLANAESPSLRRLTASFEDLHNDDDESNLKFQRSGRQDAVSGVEKSIWKTLLGDTEVPKVAIPRAKRKRARSVTAGLHFTSPTSQSDHIPSSMDIISLGMLQTEASGYVDILQLGEPAPGSWDVRPLTPGAEADNGSGERCHQAEGPTLKISDTFLCASLSIPDTDDGLQTAQGGLHGWETRCRDMEPVDTGCQLFHDGEDTLIMGAHRTMR